MTYLDKANKIAFTAPTGIAACNIRGMTIHSWSGIGLGSVSTYIYYILNTMTNYKITSHNLGTDSIEKTVGMIKNNRDSRKRWMDVEILVIDEISMLSNKLFDMLSKVGSRIRSDDRPFGGIQLILCGITFLIYYFNLFKTSI